MALARNIGVSQAERYYDQDDYYTKNSAAPSRWHGEGAKALGLSGAVRPEDFKPLLRGELPDGSALHPGGGPRVAGTDFEFSAPKSFSIQALVAGDERLVAVHQQAVAVARQRLEATTATRVTQGGKTRVAFTGNAVLAEFLHTTSRAGDPDLHSHVVALNLTRRQDGQWRSVDNRAMFKEQRLMYDIYLSELARGAKALGYAVTKGKHGNPELAHISRAQIERFSARGGEVEAELARRGLSRETATPQQKRAATLATRNAKQAYDRVRLIEEWRIRALGAGMDLARPDASASRHETSEMGPHKTLASERKAARAAVSFALAHLGEREAAFERSEVVRTALKAYQGETRYAAITTELARREKRGQVLTSKDKTRVTTQKALEIEHQLLTLERVGRERVVAIAAPEIVARMLSRQTLTVGQAAAVELASTSRNQVNAIQGYAGSGKTTALNSFREIATTSGYEIVGLAPSHSAVKALDDSGIAARTLQSWLADRSAASKLNDRTVLVLDEAGLVGNRQLLSTLERANRSGARVLLIGDARQYQSVAAGRGFIQLQQQGMATAKMTEILRQKDGKLLEAARLSVDQPARALTRLEVREIRDPGERYQRLALDYAGLSREERENTLILTGTNAARREINAAVRASLEGRGELGGATATLRVFQRKDLTAVEQKRLDRHAVGDAVWFQKAYPSLGIERGEMVFVASIESDQVTVTRSSGQEVRYVPAALSAKGFQLGRIEERPVAAGEFLRITGIDRELGIRNGERGTVESLTADEMVLKDDKGGRKSLPIHQVLPVEHGYAATGHSAQGLGARRVLMDKDATARTTDHRSFYTDLTRAKEIAVIYTDDRSALPMAVQRESQKTAAHDVESDRSLSGAVRNREMGRIREFQFGWQTFF